MTTKAKRPARLPHGGTLFTTSRGVIPYYSCGSVIRSSAITAWDARSPPGRQRCEAGLPGQSWPTAVAGLHGQPPVPNGGSWTRRQPHSQGWKSTRWQYRKNGRPVGGWPFEVSSWGRVRRSKGPSCSNMKGRWGHLKVCLFRNGAQMRGTDRRDFPVHRLVAEAFVPNSELCPRCVTGTVCLGQSAIEPAVGHSSRKPGRMRPTRHQPQGQRLAGEDRLGDR